MNSYFAILLILATFSSSTFALPKPNDLKEKSPEENEIPLKKVFGKGVGAEWGGYRASAGLGGGENGGGLFARADAPGSSAGAGISSGSGGAGAYAGGPGGSPNGGFFDRIFANNSRSLQIPINVLHSVNTYVKTKNDGKGPSASAGAGAYAGASHEASAGVAGTETRFADSQSGAGASASASASAGGHHGVKPGGKPDYDKIFNIPISALKSVNDFLNGR